MSEDMRPYRELADELPQPVFETDADGMITYANRSAFFLFEYDEEDLARGLAAVDFIAEEDRPQAARNIARVIGGEKLGPNEYRLRKKGGSLFPGLVHSRLTQHDGAPAGLQGVIVDLSDLRRSEAERERTEGLYRAVVENTGTGILIIEGDMTVSFVNQEMIRLSGRAREEWLGKPFPLDWVLPEYRKVVADSHRRRRIDPASVPASYEIGFRDAEGLETHVLLNVSVIPGTTRSIASIVDATDRILSVRRLRESEEKFRELAEYSPNMIFIHQDDRTVYANRLCETTFGYSRAELYSPEFDFRHLIAPDSRELVELKYAARLRGEEVGVYELGMVTREGRRIDVLNNSTHVMFQGRPAMLGIITEITARKRTEEDLERALAEMERQNRELKKIDRMKDALIRDVSHELKTPVAKHIMQLEILKPIIDRYCLTQEERRALEVMEKSIRRQESVIRNLLDLSRLEAGERSFRREEVRLDRVIDDVIRDYSHATDAHDIRVDAEVPPLTVTSDPEMLWHLLSNLLNNAIKFSPKEKKSRIRVTTAEEMGEVRIAVRDNGIGMEPEQIEQAFSRFYQGSASYEGSGVGLTICRMIASGLGGWIWLESEGIGKGTTANVTLPLR